MTDRPINLADWQVRAALDGRLSLVVEPITSVGCLDKITKDYGRGGGYYVTDSRGGWQSEVKINRATGDRLWVREKFAISGIGWGKKPSKAIGGKVHCAADPNHGWHSYWGNWYSSTNMPRWASRLTLGVTDVRVMRVQEIEWRHVSASGLDVYFEKFSDFWNAKRGLGWDANPWVTATTVTVHRCNIDQMEVHHG